MKTPADLYAEKLTTAEEAVSRIQSGDHIVKGMAVAEPPAILEEIANRVAAHDLENLTLYYYHSLEHSANTILRYELLDQIRVKCGFFHTTERQIAKRALKEGRKVLEFLPNSFSEFPRMLRSEALAIDTTILTVSPMDKFGYFTFGTNHDYGPAAARVCKRLIVEVNENMPRINGRTNLHVSEVDAIVENHVPLIEVSGGKDCDEAPAIARNVVDLIPNGATLQMGVGSIPNHVCKALMGHEDLGIHSECLTPGMVELVRAGVATGAKKTIDNRKAIFSFTWGDRAHYDYLDDNLYFYAYPVDYVVDPEVIARNDNFISINSLIEIDLYGQVNAEFLNRHQFSATGGQLDFVRGAQRSKNGKSILAFTSAAGGGRFSRIVPRLNGPVTDTRLDTQYIVTEYGIANLKGKTSTERALALIEIAHPDFREGLLKAAHELYLL